MPRIAHLSDVHLLDSRGEARGARYRFATKLLNVGQGPVHPHDRVRRLARALRAAREHGADHIVISGDLTEVGEDAEFERFAEVLHDARLPEDTVTLVPGNHDRYTRDDAWARAMAGPLARFARASAAGPGKVVDGGDIVFLPIDTTRFQTMAWSGGLFTEETARLVDQRMTDPAFRQKAVVLVMHHPPFHPVRTMKWIDGLRGAETVLRLLARHPRLALLHGHLHRSFNHILSTSNTAFSVLGRAGKPVLRRVEATDGTARLFGAPATSEGPDDAGDDVRGFRVYDVCEGAIQAVSPVAPTRAA